MTDAPVLIYLEADDEITAVVRRVRAADPGRIVIVAPGRSRATSSVVALRLLARAGEEEGRELAIVGDGLTRSLAAEAGLTAYGTVDDARRADPVASEASGPRHAAIHVVRGPMIDETAPVPVSVRNADTETRAVPVVPATPPGAARRPRRRALNPLPLLAVLGVLLLTASAAAAAILPAATVRIAPVSELLGPFPYEVRIADPERVAGTVEETTTVTATGTYPIQVAATGTVVLFNWNFVPVEVPAGTLVAAGDQAFETLETIVVPPGEITGAGTIQAGEGVVGVRASAAGPAANVAATDIDTVLNEGTAGRLRGFPSNRQGLVTNPEPTTGGLEDTGVEFTQADLDAALTSLRDALVAGVDEALEVTAGVPHADPIEPLEPVIEGIDELVGTRDQETAEISGTLAYDRLVADQDEVTADAIDQFGRATGSVPEGQELVADSTRVEVGEVSRDGDTLVVAVTVTARSTPLIDRAEVLSRIIGRSGAEAQAALADLGEASVDLWPGWVASVPDSEWRIEITLVDEEAVPEPSGS